MIKLYQGDCLEVMDKLIKQNIKVDAIITDPPYGTTACKWDAIIPFDKMWLRLKALRKEKTPIVLFGSEPFSSYLRMSNIKEYKYDWVWHKSCPSNIALVNKQPLKYHEIISVFYISQSLYNKQMIKRDPSGIAVLNRYKKNNTSIKFSGSNIHNTTNIKKEYDINRYDTNFKNPSTVLNIKSKRGKAHIHPTQKPVKLIAYLIKTYTNENDLVLDFTMGIGSTGIACKKLNRNFIGIENNKKYFNFAKEFLKED